MALITFEDLPSTNTPINSANLNNNFNEVGADTGWQTLNSTIKYRKIGKTVFVVGKSSGETLIGNGNYTIVGTLPTGYRPSIQIPFVTHYISGIHEGQSNYIDPSGLIRMYLPSGDTTEYWMFSLSFPV